MRRLKWFIVLLFVLICGAGYCETKSEKDAVLPSPQIAGAEYVGMDTCAMCHEKIAKEFKRSAHARLVAASKQEGQGCETCHGPGSLHADVETKADKKA